MTGRSQAAGAALGASSPASLLVLRGLGRIWRWSSESTFGNEGARPRLLTAQLSRACAYSSKISVSGRRAERKATASKSVHPWCVASR